MTRHFSGKKYYWDRALERVKERATNEIIDGCELADKLNELTDEIEQLKEQIKIYDKFLDGNDLYIEWDLFCIADTCWISEDEEFDCKDCKYMRLR